MALDKRDIELIRVLQREEIFLDRSPFEKAANILGWSADEVLSRSRRLKDEGVIRRFGAALTPRNAGFSANAMVAWDLPDGMEAEAEVFAAHPRVSHCYIRPRFEGFPYNLYTMMHGSSAEDLNGIIVELSKKTSITSYRALSSLKEFKKSSPVYFPEYSLA